MKYGVLLLHQNLIYIIMTQYLNGPSYKNLNKLEFAPACYGKGNIPFLVSMSKGDTQIESSISYFYVCRFYFHASKSDCQYFIYISMSYNNDKNLARLYSQSHAGSARGADRELIFLAHFFSRTP